MEVIHVEFFIRLRLRVRDRAGHEFPIAFYPEGGEQPVSENFRIGHTMVILYPHQHHFMDMTIGIRQKDMRTIQVRPQKQQPNSTDLLEHSSFVSGCHQHE